MAEKNYVLNVKTKNNTIFTVRADTASELKENITDVITNSLEDHVLALEELLLGVAPTQTPSATPSAVDVVTEALGGTVVSETPIPAFAPVPPPPAQSTASQVGARMCQHGAMVGRKGNGAKGEWKGLFCPTPKGTAGQCDPVWLNRSMPEWSTI
jgi:hypothetical protein